MSVESDELLIKIQTAAAGPASVSGDAGSVTQQKLTDLIAFHRYLSSQEETTTSRSAHRGLRFSKMIPPGAV